MKISFEDALKRLDEISIKLESSNVSLSDSLKLYEEAVELGEFCKNELNIEIEKTDKKAPISIGACATKEVIKNGSSK